MATGILDERADPPLRRVISRLLTRSDAADVALTRVRIATLDLTPAETVARCRVLLGRLDAHSLHESGQGTAGTERPPPPGADRLSSLRDWLVEGRLEVRSAGIAAWTPDFSIYATREGPVSLLGAHYFGSPHLTVGPSFTMVSRDAGVARALEDRFEELWLGSHDVAPAILAVLERGPDHGLGAAAAP